MQGLARHVDRQLATAAVGGITHHRVIHMRAVHADLVRTPGVQLEAQQRVITKPLLQTPVGAGKTTALAAHHRIFLAIRRVAADGPHNRSAVSCRHPMNHRQVLP